MYKYLKRNRLHFAGALIFVFFSTVFAVVLQFFKGEVLDYAIVGETRTTVRYGILLITFILGESLCYFGYRKLSARFVVGCTKQLKKDIFTSIIQREFVSYKKLPQGEYIAKYMNEADTIKERRFRLLPMFWEILFTIIFVSTALFVLDWKIAIITIGLLTTPLYIPKLIEKRLQKAQTEYLKAVEMNLAKVNDWLNGFEVIKNYSIERRILSKFDQDNVLTMEKLLRDMTFGAVSQLITMLISYLSYFVVLVFAAWLVLKGDFSAGDFFVAIGMIDQLSYPLISLAEIIRQLIAIKPSCRAMEEFIAGEKTQTCGKVLTTLTDGINYRNVTFSYVEGKPVLRNFNFEAKKGRRYLIKGSSGCGKTTAVNLLLRYYDVDSGSIEIDNTPLSEYSSTYGCITVVRQEAVLFHDTLRCNLTMYQDIADNRLFEMLESVGLNKFLNEQALDEEISENGANLSGGEKKRICLARALLRDTDVLILDEPLANLDEETAYKIEDLILSIEGKLVLVVSHQFSEEKLKRFDAVMTMVNA